MDTKNLYHGGALDVAISEFGGKASDWLDMSTGINPYHYPIADIDPLAWRQLPQKSELDLLIKVASHAYGCSKNQILAGNGTQTLIEKLPQIFETSTIAIMAPTYEEHAHNWRKFGHRVIFVEDFEQARDADHLLIVNPNNPSGTLYEPEKLLEIHSFYAQKGGCLIVDEAFMDMTPDKSLATHIGLEGLIILRSFGKFFGLAGVRVGFILGAEALLLKMSRIIGLWDIAGPSLSIATSALGDEDWQQKMRTKLAADMTALMAVLQANGFEVLGKTDLFCLASIPTHLPSAVKCFEKLAKHHILTRKFDNNDKILRFGLLETAHLQVFAEKLPQVMRSLNHDN